MKTYKKSSSSSNNKASSQRKELQQQQKQPHEKEVSGNEREEAENKETDLSKARNAGNIKKMDTKKGLLDENNNSRNNSNDDDDDDFVAERLTAKHTTVPAKVQHSPSKSPDSGAAAAAEYKKFVEEQRRYFDSLDSYSLVVEKDHSASASKKGKRRSLVSPIKPSEEANSGDSLPPSAKKRRRGSQQQQQQLGFISPIRSGNSSLSRTGKSGEQEPGDENSYDDSFDREIESEFMSQSKSKSRIENSFDSLVASPIKK